MRATPLRPTPSERLGAPRYSPAMPMTPARPRRVHLVAVVVTLLSLLVTASLALAARESNDSTERRLLREQLAQAGASVATSVTGIQRSLTAAVVAAAAPGTVNTAAFTRIVTPLVSPQGQFVSVTLWESDATAPAAVVGAPGSLSEVPTDQRRSILARAQPGTLAIVTRLNQDPARLGYAVADVADSSRLVVYAESQLPDNRTTIRNRTDPYRNVDYALYIGRKGVPERLLASSLPIPLRGTRASLVTPFGDRNLLLVFVAHSGLAGSLSRNLFWMIGLGGTVLALAAGLAVEALARRGDRAAALAAENERLYGEERDIAVTLQRSLRPRDLREIQGVEIAARYEPAAGHSEIGGDWYDILELPPGRRLFLTIGDVSGHGIPAAATMAGLRFAARAYAAEGHDPATVLERLANLLDVGDEAQFATVLCLCIDVDAGTVVAATAGHPSPLVVEADRARYLDVPVGPPIGMRPSGAYEQTTIHLAGDGMLVAFTDGLVERRGEMIDIGLDRVLRMAGGEVTDVAALITGMAHDGASERRDDLAIVGLRWMTANRAN